MDPSPGKKKGCYCRGKVLPQLHEPAITSPSGLAKDDTICAHEGQICRCQGPVMYGANPHWSQWLNVGTSVVCNAVNFGGDPYSGQHKSCYCRGKILPAFDHPHTIDDKSTDKDDNNTTGIPNTNLSVCAKAGEMCSCDGVIRFGVGKKWTEWAAKDTPILCNIENFGDPAPGKKKKCQCLEEVEAKTSANSGRKCANHGEMCECQGVVRYGRCGHWSAWMNKEDPVLCTGKQFGATSNKKNTCECLEEFESNNQGYGKGGVMWMPFIVGGNGVANSFSGHSATKSLSGSGEYPLPYYQGFNGTTTPGNDIHIQVIRHPGSDSEKNN